MVVLQLYISVASGWLLVQFLLWSGVFGRLVDSTALDNSGAVLECF
jgi:hypothetical protein